MADKKKTFATVNFGNMHVVPLNHLSTFQLKTNELIIKNKALDDAKKLATEKAIKENIADDQRKKYIAEAIKNEKLERDNVKDKCKALATAFIVRYISAEDALNGNLYNFDMKSFLTEIGVYTDGEDDKKAMKRVNEIRASVVDRKENKASKFNGKNADENGNAVLSDAVIKTIANSEIELVLAIIKACIESGAIEYSKGGLAFVNFDKK